METCIEEGAKICAKDQLYCWHPYRQAHTEESPLPVLSAKGAEISLSDGSTLIDAAASWWVNLHGHGHPHIVEAIANQARNLAHVGFSDLTHEPAVLLAEKLSSLLPGNLQRIFYSDNGSTAVETALKIAMQLNGKKIVAFRNGYHGETFGAMSVTSRTLFSKPFEDFLFDVEWIDPPFVGHEEKSVEQMKKILNSNEVGAFIFEPWVQGVGGMVPHSIQGLDELISRCKEKGVFTIADEVFTGCGRLGPLFASEKFENSPDMICLAKALTGGTIPLGVTACTEEIYEQFLSEKREEAFLHGHSYCGNPIGCATALASLEILCSEECTKQRRAIEESHLKAAQAFREDPHFGRVDVIGTLFAVDYALGEKNDYYHPARNRLSEFFIKNGVLMRPLGNTLYIVPPYCITQKQLDHIYETFWASTHIPS